MHEYIDVRFRRKNKPFRVKRQTASGIEFDETDPISRTITIGFAAADEITRYRVSRIAQVKDWGSGQFQLRISVEDGSIVLRGDDEDSLPEGRYHVTVNVSDAQVDNVSRAVVVPHDDHAELELDLTTDERTIDVDLVDADADILRVLDASVLDGQPARKWVANSDFRPTRRACVLNLLASLRVTPLVSTPLIGDVQRLFRAREERAYAVVERSLFSTVSDLSDRDDRPFYREGRPNAPIHKELLDAVWAEEPPTKAVFTDEGLRSFRAEGAPSLQLVMSTPQANFAHTFLDADLDLGNPLQDVAGLIVHLGELLNGTPTNHLDLAGKLSKGKAKPYLYYRVAS